MSAPEQRPRRLIEEAEMRAARILIARHEELAHVAKLPREAAGVAQ